MRKLWSTATVLLESCFRHLLWMKGPASSTCVRSFLWVLFPRPVVLVLLIHITSFKLCGRSALKSNQGSWGRNECLSFDPWSRTEASFGCSQWGLLCCLQHKLSHCLHVMLFSDILAIFSLCSSCESAVGCTIQAKHQSPQVPQPKAFLLTLLLLFASEFVDDVASTWHAAGRKGNSCRGSHYFSGQHFYAVLQIISHWNTTNFAGSGGDQKPRCGCRILSKA